MSDSRRPLPASPIKGEEPKNPSTTAQAEAETQAPARTWQQSAALAALAVAAVLGLAWAVARSQSAHPFYGSVYSGEQPAPTFSGEVWNPQADAAEGWTFAPEDRISLLFFGFVHCPDICPLTLKYLGDMRAQLSPAENARIDVVFVSVDPERDTPEVIDEYVRFFGEGVGVRVPEPRLTEVANAYGVAYGKVELDEGPLEYQINHTTATYLIDENANIRVLWDYTQLPDVERILSDVRYVMENPLPREP